MCDIDQDRILALFDSIVLAHKGVNESRPPPTHEHLKRSGVEITPEQFDRLSLPIWKLEKLYPLKETLHPQGLDEQKRSDDAMSLMKALKLPLTYFPALISVLQETQWRTARKPIAYVKATTERKAIELGMGIGRNEERSLNALAASRSNAWRSANKSSDSLQKASLQKLPFSKDDRYKQPSPFHTEEDEYQDALDSRSYDIGGRIVPSYAGHDVNLSYLKVSSDDEGELEVDGHKVIDDVGLDELEANILRQKLSGVGRSEILAASGCEEDRKDLQAAYKRLDRKMPDIYALLSAT